MEREELVLKLKKLAVRISEGWDEVIEIDALDIMLLNEAAEALAQSAQRTWVGLTAEEAAECWTTSATQTWKNFEAKLKEKNNG